MEIAFIQNILNHHFGIMYLSSMVKSIGCNVELFVQPCEKDMISSITRFSPDMICISLFSGDQNWALEVAKQVKTRLPKTKVVAGGPHITMFPDFINKDNIDIICIGEGEEALVELAQAIKEGKDISDIKNLWVKTPDNKIIKNALRPLVENIDTIPFPDREIYNKYNIFKNSKEIPIITARGCPWRCSFCHNEHKRSLYKGSKYVRVRSTDNIIEELTMAKKMYLNANSVVISDDILGINKLWLKEFLEKYSKHINLKFLASIRADLINEDSIRYLKNANCNILSIGLETGSFRIRKEILNKNISDDKFIRAAKLIRENGIKLRTTNIFALPNETFSEALETIKMNQMMNTDIPIGYIFQPYPGTRLYEYIIENKLADLDSYQIDRLGVVDNCLKNDDKDKIIALQRLFYFFIKFPRLSKFWLFLTKFHKRKNILNILYGFSTFMVYANTHTIEFSHIFKVLWQYNKLR